MGSSIKVPELGESVVEATVGRWLKKEGERVQVGDVLVELETDKANLEVGAEHAGVLAKIAHDEGDDVQIGDVLGTIEDAPERDDRDGDGEKGSAKEGSAKEGSAKEGSAKEGSAKEGSAKEGSAKEGSAKEGSAKEGSAKEGSGDGKKKGGAARDASNEAKDSEDEERSGETDGRSGAKGEGTKASPAARRLARERDVDLAEVPGSGAGNRIKREDIERFLEERGADEPEESEKPEKDEKDEKPEETPPKPGREPATRGADETGGRRERRVRMSRRRQTIARRLVESQHTAAILTTFNELDMTEVIELRKRKRDEFEKRHGVRLGFMSFFTKAVIAAAREFPELNAEIDGTEIVYKDYYDIGIAVGAKEGLVVPVLRDADRMSFAQIEKTIRALAKKADEGSLSIEELRGGTFTLTNGGVFGSLMATPIINPPQVGILGLHKIEERPIAVDKEVVVRPMMYVALSYDHRIVDGRESVQFLKKIKELIEDPASLLLEGD